MDLDLTPLLHSPWLLPALAVLVLLDAPFPMVPSEAALMSVYGLAVAEREWWLAATIYLAALVGAVAGDALMWRLGATTRKVPDIALTAWIAETVRERPGAVLVGARFVPMGRLVSTMAAGRAGVPFARYLPWATLTSAVWAFYMLLAGLVIAPLVGGDPLRAFLAGLVMAALLGGLAAAIRWLRSVWQARSPRPVAPMVRRKAAAFEPGVRVDVTQETATAHRLWCVCRGRSLCEVGHAGA